MEAGEGAPGGLWGLPLRPVALLAVVSYASIIVFLHAGIKSSNSRVVWWAKLGQTCMLMGLVGVLAAVLTGLPFTTTAVNSRPLIAVPASADVGQTLIPWISDPKAVDPQAVCPGYTALNVRTGLASLTADLRLAGPACHVYGNDVEYLTLKVEFEAADRLHVEIQPRYLGPENETWFVLPEALVPRPAAAENASQASSELEFSWSNDPSFVFTVRRRATGDTPVHHQRHQAGLRGPVHRVWLVLCLRTTTCTASARSSTVSGWETT